MSTLWSRFVDYARQPRHLIGASVFRLVAGATILLQYLCDYHERRYLFGPNGIYPYDAFVHYKTTLSLFSLSPSMAWFELVYHAGIFVAALWTCGLWTRWLTPLLCVLWSSVHYRLDTYGDGGDNLMSLVLVYVCFCDLGAHFTLFERAPRAPGLRRDLSAMLHNAGMLACALQVCLVYGVAGLTKVQGDVWRNGTALYYALANPDFTLPGVSQLLVRNGLFVTLLSYSTVFFQVSFTWWLFLNRYTRVVAVVVGMTFHLGIATVMGLVSFAVFMMAVDLSLLTDDEYRAFGRLALRTGRWLRARALRLPAPAPQSRATET